MAGEAYWANSGLSEIAAFTSLVVAVSAISAPFISGWWQNRSKVNETGAHQEESTQERLERIANEQFKRLEAERDSYMKRCDEALAEIEVMRASARGMEDWAHYFRHEAVNLIQRYHSLFGMFEMAIRGEMAQERVAIVLEQLRARLPTEPRHVPLLRDASKDSAPL